jgi:hypothetical protein
LFETHLESTEDRSLDAWSEFFVGVLVAATCGTISWFTSSSVASDDDGDGRSSFFDGDDDARRCFFDGDDDDDDARRCFFDGDDDDDRRCFFDGEGDDGRRRFFDGLPSPGTGSGS